MTRAMWPASLHYRVGKSLAFDKRPTLLVSEYMHTFARICLFLASFDALGYTCVTNAVPMRPRLAAAVGRETAFILRYRSLNSKSV